MKLSKNFGQPIIRFLFNKEILGLTFFTAALFTFSVSNAQNPDLCENQPTLPNPSTVAQKGIGGTGVTIVQSDTDTDTVIDTDATDVDSSGIGGTGIEVRDYGGIGGTGIVNTTSNMDSANDKAAEENTISGIGIVGTITGLTSICVNGIEIHVDENTHVTMDSEPSAIGELTIGQLAIVRAENHADSILAQQIAITHTMVGPVMYVNRTANEIHVLDQIIQSPHIPNTLEEFSSKWIKISGQRLADGKIIASHFQLIQPLETSIINGRITQINPGEIIVEGTRVVFSPQTWPDNLVIGMEVSVSGYWDGKNIQAQSIQIEPTRHVLGSIEHIVIEGYVRALYDQTLELSNQSVTINSNTFISDENGEALQLNQYIKVIGQLTSDNHIIADKLELKQPILPLDNTSIESSQQQINGTSTVLSTEIGHEINQQKNRLMTQ